MRKFIVSDLHGNGNIYGSIMSFLDNLSKEEEISLYVNGDLIDKGPSSAEMLLDIKNRILSNSFPIIYLGGNHELLMYQIFEKRKKRIYIPDNNDWYRNGGLVTDRGLEEKLKSREKILEVSEFISNLNIYHKFQETIDGKNIVLVHAICPLKVEDVCNLKIKDDNSLVEFYVWTRAENPFLPFRNRIGSPDYFTIVGHTYVTHPYGFLYNSDENYINIDGGCAAYVLGDVRLNHTPLVEIDNKNNRLILLTFNNENEIAYGNYLEDGMIFSLPKEKMNQYKKYLKKRK